MSTENTLLSSLISDQKFNPNQEAILSLVKEVDGVHAYIILECSNTILPKGDFKKSDYRALAAHLGVNPNEKSKAIISLEVLDANELTARSCELHYFQWPPLKVEYVTKIYQLIMNQKQKADKGEILYVKSGSQYTLFGGSIGESLEKGKSYATKESLEDNCQNSVTQGLLIKGHNCCSWILDEIIAPLNLPQPNYFKPLLYVNPENFVNTGRTCNII